MAAFGSFMVSFHTMTSEQFKRRIKQNFDTVIFSRLLELDYEENRMNSYITLYAHIAAATNATYEMKKALFNKDIPQLRSLCDHLNRRSNALGMYRIGEECEEIRILSARLDEKGRARDGETDAGEPHIEGALTRLEVSVASAHAALDDFYAAR